MQHGSPSLVIALAGGGGGVGENGILGKHVVFRRNEGRLVIAS